MNLRITWGFPFIPLQSSCSILEGPASDLCNQIYGEEGGDTDGNWKHGVIYSLWRVFVCVTVVIVSSGSILKVISTEVSDS